MNQHSVAALRNDSSTREVVAVLARLIRNPTPRFARAVYHALQCLPFEKIEEASNRVLARPGTGTHFDPGRGDLDVEKTEVFAHTSRVRERATLHALGLVKSKNRPPKSTKIYPEDKNKLVRYMHKAKCDRLTYRDAADARKSDGLSVKKSIQMIIGVSQFIPDAMREFREIVLETGGPNTDSVSLAAALAKLRKDAGMVGGFQFTAVISTPQVQRQ